MLEQNLIKAIKEINPMINHVKTYSNSSLYVCKVELRKTPFIMKIFDERAMPDVRHELSWGREQINNEEKALDLLKGVQGIPKLHKTYKKGSFKALLKEYIHGREADSFKDIDIFDDFKGKLWLLNMNMIHRGVYFLDAKPSNIFVTKDNDPYVIDLGYVKFEKDISQNTKDFFLQESFNKFKSYANHLVEKKWLID